MGNVANKSVERDHLVVGATFIKGEHVPQGSVLTLDDGKPEDLNLLTELYPAGRLVLATDENIKKHFPDAKTHPESLKAYLASKTKSSPK